MKLNKIEGGIPESFGMLANLQFIDVSYNQLQGSLPDTLLYNCSHLSYVDLSTNMFTGSIPAQIGNHLPHLQNFLIYSNNLFGSIPVSLTNSTFLWEIDIENNSFGGTLPSEIFMKMFSLKRLHLSYNNFSSYDQNTNLVPFFNAISNLTLLEELEVAGNKLGGELPSTIGLLGVNISEIDLKDNFIQGIIPSNLSKLSNLMFLDLSNNLLHGTIPLELVLLPKLQRLWLSNNSLSGEIPSPPRVLTNIGLLDLSKNKLFGSIPETLANLTLLRTLILSENLFSGVIPSTLGSIKLELLDLSHNRLIGTIPAEVARLSSMAFYFNLSDNLLQGKLPMELGQMNKVNEIDLSSNNFSGHIPSSMGSCEMLELVKFSHNHLQGPIPESLGSLRNIESIDVSYNNLSGGIPNSLQQCTNLRLLNLAFNNFSGALPRGGIFNLLTLEWIKGNHFCGSVTGIPSCHHKKRSMMHSHKGFVLVIIIVTLSAFLITVICGTLYLMIRKQMNKRQDGDPRKSSMSFSSSFPRITYRELVEATDGFENNRLLGSGSFGRVYKGVLGDDTLVAIKVLQLQSGNSTKSFKRECQVLKTIRHRNLMRIITACSLPDFKALVLPFMANGSLESHLYPQAERADSSQLSLLERVNICSDIAEGLAYLHHHSPVKVIHCDLKPSNILLNDDMTALVSDFGIARLVMSVEGGNTTNESTANVICGSIGYVAPEYGYGRNASTKGDVYSFGILVLEIVTRKRPTHDMFGEDLSLQRWVKKYYKSQVESIVDSNLMREVCDQSLEVRNMWEVAILELLELGLVCSLENPSARLTMLDAADDLGRLKRYLGGDTSATFTSSIGASSSSITADYWYDADPHS
ncbi:leucine-rich repeat receptor-like serine/threonine-protein kinase [Canna indica]|uniref:non-specific serine/threonine protein kinase n=1 Tax=Canna indica TaxID=4628 RepID=A0AAQ3KRN7_9LILI|nr:leucine-rich repeat receptor-like serine/threonine-protein kinase [Canna indica]